MRLLFIAKCSLPLAPSLDRMRILVRNDLQFYSRVVKVLKSEIIVYSKMVLLLNVCKEDLAAPCNPLSSSHSPSLYPSLSHSNLLHARWMIYLNVLDA